jgi:hypothetical protein
MYRSETRIRKSQRPKKFLIDKKRGNKDILCLIRKLFQK